MNTIAVSDDIKALQGIGIEYLLDASGMPIAKFINGNLDVQVSSPNSNEITKGN